MRSILFFFAFATTGAYAQSNLPDAPHIYVEGSAEVRLEPDVFRITGKISSTAPVAAEAERSIYEKSAALLKACKDHGVKSDQISSSTVSMYPRYGREGRQLVSYELRRKFEITLTDLDKYYPTLRAIVESGAVSDLDTMFTVSDFEPSIIRAQQLAIEDAHARAERLANQAGMELGSVYSITEFNLRDWERGELEPQRHFFESNLEGFLEEIVVVSGKVAISHHVEPLFEPSSIAATATVFVVYLLVEE